MTTQISRKKWRWIGHTLRKPHKNVIKQALFWNPLGFVRGRPKNNWGRSAEQELRQIGLQWTQTEQQAQDRNCGRPLLHLGAKGLYIYSWFKHELDDDLHKRSINFVKG